MSMWRLRTVDGKARSISAGRIVVADGEVRFQSPGTTGWVTVEQAVLSSVSSCDRRFNEADGRVRWVAEGEVNAAAEAARPEQPTTEKATTEQSGTETGADSDTGAHPPVGRAAAATPAAPAADEPAAVSARDVRCPQCGEEEELSGRRVRGAILLTCHSCGYDGPRVARRRCPTCGGDDVVERPKALVERSRGTQLSVVGYTTVALCRSCDADALAAALAHGGAVMPAELPTVDPETLRETRPNGPGPRRPS
jgi:predicted RNA-binding Zn-ribbon protein involved in translation (DUF1610 family)